jgi:glycosyltransferase involved in cell wall biosynthesis
VTRGVKQIEPENGGNPQRATAAGRFKVLHIGKFYPPHMGGIETHLQTLCSELQKSVGLDVLVASDDRTGAEEVLDGVKVSRVATRITLASSPFCPDMILKIRNSDADILHIHLPNPTAILAYLASGHRGRLVVTYHSDTVRQKVLGALFEPFLHAALRRSDAVIATSPEYLRTSPVLARYRDRCHVIPYGIPLEQFENADPSEANAIRQQYGDRLILSVGRLVYYKGFEYLIGAMKHVNGRLLIIGGGPLREKLEELARGLRLGDKVIFAGEIQNQNVIPYYHAAALFALASVARSEAFGIVQIEAMAAGIPVVNTRLDSGVPFVSLHEKTGLTATPCDSSALAAAINRLLDDPSLRRSFGDAARIRARQEFSLDTMTSRTLSLYNEVLNGRKPAEAEARSC